MSTGFRSGDPVKALSGLPDPDRIENTRQWLLRMVEKNDQKWSGGWREIIGDRDAFRARTRDKDAIAQMWDKLFADVLQELTADTVLEEELGPRLGIVMDMVEALERFRRLRTKKAVEDLRGMAKQGR